MPLDMFMGKAIRLDLSHIPDLGDIDIPALEAAEKKAGVKIDGHIVFDVLGLACAALSEGLRHVVQCRHHP